MLAERICAWRDGAHGGVTTGYCVFCIGGYFGCGLYKQWDEATIRAISYISYISY